MSFILSTIPYILALGAILLGVATIRKEWEEYKDRRLRMVVLFLLIILGVLSLFQLYRDNREKEQAKKKADEDINSLKNQLNDAKEKADHEAQERRFAELSKTYEDRLSRSTVDNEVEAAAEALREIAVISSFFQDHPDPLRHWVSAREMTQPQFVHVLLETGMVRRRIIDRSSSERLSQTMLWRVRDQGKKAIERRDFVALRKNIEDSVHRANNGYGLTLSHILYGRYWGVALVTESSYQSCDAWEYDKPREVERDPPLLGVPLDMDPRIFGQVRVRMIAGVAWLAPKSPREQGEPIRVGQSVNLLSEHGSWDPYQRLPRCATSNNIFIRGCPKVGDLVAYVEDECAQQWENLSDAE
jgi:hypothetical protein